MYKRRLIPLTSLREVVTAFGGTNALAKRCDIVPSNISDWLAANCIPQGWHYRLDRWAKELGFFIDPGLFEEDPTPEENVILERQRVS